MKKLLFSMLLMPMFCTAQTTRHSLHDTTPVDTMPPVDTLPVSEWITLRDSVAIFQPKSDTIEVYNIVGIYGDGSLRMFSAKYLIRKPWGIMQIIDAPENALLNLIGVYSYDDGSVHTVSFAIHHCYQGGEKKGNWIQNYDNYCK